VATEQKEEAEVQKRTEEEPKTQQKVRLRVSPAVNLKLLSTPINWYCFQKRRLALPRLPTLGGLLHQLQQMSSQNSGAPVSENDLTARMMELCPKWKVTVDEAKPYLRQVCALKLPVIPRYQVRVCSSAAWHWRAAKPVLQIGRGWLEGRWQARGSASREEASWTGIGSSLQDGGSEDGTSGVRGR